MGGGHHHSPEAMPKKDQDLELLKKHRIPLGLRDSCAHLLIPLDECRRETLFNPDRCTHQRHTYEECQFIAWSQRVEDKKQMKAAEAAAAKVAATMK
jgi:NADH dehydrogenase (ubiquinone) 1 beta subcomplex subunit 7